MEVSFADSLLLSVIGIAIAFIGLVLLMIIIYFISRFSGADKMPVPAAATGAVYEQPQPPVPADDEAYSSALNTEGRIELTNVPDRTAAMLMAIVAAERKTQPSQLRFISARKLEDEKGQDK